MVVLLAWVGVLGLIVGSFLNVVIARVPAGLSVVAPRSRCPQCQHEIAWRDNIPVLSWIALRGRCRGCKTRISIRYPLIELATGILFVGLTAFVDLPTAPLVIFVGAACLALAIIDMDTMRLPDPVTLAAAVLALAGSVAAGALSGEWHWGRAAASAGFWFAFFAIPWFATAGKGMGFGDVKLAPVLGWTLGWLGWGQSSVGLAAGFALAATVGGLFALWKRRWRLKVPFGPFMVAGALVGVLVGPAVLGWYLRVFFPYSGWTV